MTNDSWKGQPRRNLFLSERTIRLSSYILVDLGSSSYFLFLFHFANHLYFYDRESDSSCNGEEHRAYNCNTKKKHKLRVPCFFCFDHNGVNGAYSNQKHFFYDIEDDPAFELVRMGTKKISNDLSELRILTIIEQKIRLPNCQNGSFLRNTIAAAKMTRRAKNTK